jgi:hypothetical protein
VLVLSVSHNVSDWGDQSRVYATFFSPEDTASPKKALRREELPARVIGRFIPNTTDGGIVPTSIKNVDVAFLAVCIPSQALESVRSRALLLSEGTPSQIHTGSRVYAAGSRGHEEASSNHGVRVAQPNFRKGIVLNPTSPPGMDATVTQFGKVVDDVVLTTIECMPGDSGGALVVVNEASNRLEVVGVCSSGGARNEFIDFPIESLGITQNEIAMYGFEQAVLRKVPEATAPHRGFFTGVKAVTALEEALVSHYQQVKKELEDIDRLYNELKSSRQQANSSPPSLDTLYQRARARSAKELELLKPNRG